MGKEHLTNLLKKIVDLLNSTSFPPERAFLAGVMIAYLQPFADGNKRTSRIVANAILLAHDFFPISYRNTNPTEYVKAMILFYEQNNLYQVKKIFMGQVDFGKDNYFIV